MCLGVVAGPGVERQGAHGAEMVGQRNGGMRREGGWKNEAAMREGG